MNVGEIDPETRPPDRVVSAEEWAAAVAAHRGLVCTVVRDLGIHGDAAEDATQEGLVELRRVLAKYDPNRHVAFSTFCRRLLVRRLIRWRKDQHAVRIPHSTQEKVEAQRRNPDTPHKAMPATIAAVDRILAGSREPMHEVEELSRGPVEVAGQNEEVERLRKAALRMPALPRMVLILDRGLFGNDTLSHREIANELEITVSAVRNLKAQAIAYLEAALASPSWTAPPPPPKPRPKQCDDSLSPVDVDLMRRAVDEIPPRLREAISCQLGIDGAPMGNREIALRLGITNERVRKLLRQATNALNSKKSA